MATMTDLEKLFRQLVLNLRATDPAQLRRPLELGDIRDGILPYRANRRALELETSEDYEVTLMRLCAGEAGLARTDPYEVKLEFASEIESYNPDLGLIQRQQKALLYLDQDAVARVSDSNPNLAFAPREPVVERERSSKKTPPPRQKLETAAARCSRCDGALPVGRVVNFCPQCGQDLRRRHCPQCNTELEPDWKHCVSCGHSLKKRK
jgi:predicted RNA-binding Zn-ribbon protein involved in translation (DUF1610 family)